MKIVDKNGVWLVNTSQYTMIDGTNGTRFESGEPTKAENTDWVKAQPVLVPFTPEAGADPTAAPAPAPAAPTPKK